MNAQGQKNGYDVWARCDGCGHEHWTALIVPGLPIRAEDLSQKCLSCIVQHPCIFEPEHDV